MGIELKSVARLFAVGATLTSFAVMSADHAESPGTDADPAADIADVYIFPSPESPSKLVGAFTFGNRPLPRSRIDGSFYCDRDVLFTFNIDRADASGNFDSVPDITIYARLGKNSQGQCGLQLENVQAPVAHFPARPKPSSWRRAGRRSPGCATIPSSSISRAFPRC